MGNTRFKQREAILKIIKSGISMNVLDSTLTMLWGNPAFYELTGYTHEEFEANYIDLKQYFKDSKESFQSLYDTFMNAWAQGKNHASADVLFPAKGENKIWVRMSGTITKQEYGIIVNISYTNIDDIMQQQKELCEITNERSDNFEWMMAEYTGNVYISDIDTYELLYVNRSACEVLQAAPEQVVGKKCYKVIQGRSSPCPFCTNALLKKNETYEWEFFNPNLNRTFMIKDRLLTWKGRQSRIELSHDMFSSEYKLAKKDQEREAILKTIPAGMVRIDAKDCNTILWHNGIFLEMIGYTEDQFINELHNTCSYLHPDDRIRTIRLVSELKETGDNVVFEARSYNRKQEERLWTVTLCYISGEDSWDGIPSYYSLGLDITDERKKIEHLTHKAEKDDLTDVYNREGIETQIKEYLNQYDQHNCALMMIDADNFKYINDHYGHMTGDLVLSEMASGMKKWMDNDDLVGRIGGDEFIVFMKSIADKAAAEQKAMELLRMFRKPFENQEKSVKVSCSIGIAFFPQHGKTFEEMYSCADKALYHAKMYGKNNYAVFTSAMLEEMDGLVSSATRTAIDSEEHYKKNTDTVIEDIFRYLYCTNEFDNAILKIFGTIEERFNISRAYIFECSQDSEYIDNTYEWCRDGIESQKASFQHIRRDILSDYDQLSKQELVYYRRDTHTAHPKQKDPLYGPDVYSVLRYPFRNKKEFTGFISFDVCFEEPRWSDEDIKSLIKISQIIDVFLENHRSHAREVCSKKKNLIN